MQESIEIISEYPDLGRCVLHWQQQVTNVCSESQCKNRRQGFYCAKCQPFHKDHKNYTNTQFVKNLAKQITSFQPTQKNNKQSLIKTFSKVRKLTQQFQKNISQINKIIRSIDTKKILFYDQVLNCSQKEMYDKLCEWQLSENTKALLDVKQTLPKLKLNHPGAPSCYENHLKKINSSLQSFNLKIFQLMEESFSISQALSFDQAIRQIEKYVPPKIIKQQAKKPSVVMQKPGSQIINLNKKDMFGSQILQKLKNSEPKNLKQIHLDGNNIDSDSMREIFSSQLKFPKLSKLIISNCYLDDQCLQILLSSDNIPALEYLNISENQFDQFNSEKIDRIKAKWPDINLLV